MKVLLGLKADYKNVTGQEWKPGVPPTTAAALTVTGTDNTATDLADQITTQGNKLRELKANKASKVGSASSRESFQLNGNSELFFIQSLS